MASSSGLCGPSNPLQQLKDHNAVDRSLQQDRFRSGSLRLRGSASQLFRTHQPSTGTPLDHEFEQFLSSSPQTGSAQFHPQLNPSPSLLPALPPQPALSSSWASDFQRLHLGPPVAISPAPQTLFQQQQQRPVSRGNVMGGGWGAEFMSQMRSASPASVSSISSGLQQQQQNMGTTGYLGSGMGYMPQSSMLQTEYSTPVINGGGLQDVKGKGVEQQFSNEDFDAMFAEAEASVISEAGFTTTTTTVTDVDARLRGKVIHSEIQLNQNHPSHLQKEDEEQEEERDEKEDADELARTAGELLDTLSQDTSQKFQESQFVALMRKLRDREVKVEDGKMVQV